METVLLPTIDKGSKLSAALEVLKEGDASAFVTLLSSGPAVIELDVLLHALRTRGDDKVGTLQPRVRTLQLPRDESADDRIRDEKARFETQDLMDAEPAGFVVTRFVRGKAEVLTRHEGHRHMLGGPPDLYRCRTDSDHVWVMADLVQPGNRCRYDGSKTDAL